MEQKHLTNTVTDCELLDTLVANILYQLMQIIVCLCPLPHGYNCMCSWGLPVVSNALWRKAWSSGV